MNKKTQSKLSSPPLPRDSPLCVRGVVLTLAAKQTMLLFSLML
jgi:hypothetical protein